MGRVEPRYVTRNIKSIIPRGFESFENDNAFFIRKKKCFKWENKKKSMADLVDYHKNVRDSIVPIIAPVNRWYLKKDVKGHLDINIMPLVYAAMHKLSELSRYTPDRLKKHFETKDNWILYEFIKTAPDQFIYSAASEITGKEFLTPSAFRTKP